MKLDLVEKISLISQVVLESKSASLEIDIVKKFMDVSIAVLEADYGYCFEYDKPSGEFKLFYQDENTPFVSQVPRQEGITAQAFRSNEPVYISQVADDPMVRSDAREHMQGVVVIPVVYEDQGYGIFDICFYRPHNFTDEEKTLCAFIGHSAAQAITINRLLKSEQSARIEAQKQEARFRALIEHSYDVIVLLRADGSILDISRSAARVTGYEVGELIGGNLVEFVHMDDIAAVQEHMQKIIDQPNTSLTIEFRYRHQNGDWRWVEAAGINMLGDPSVAGIVANIRDITDRKEAERTILHQAQSDPLTELPNRQEFGIRFEQALEIAKRNSHEMAIMFLDMDRFKNINDRLGHSVGDTLLKVAASRFLGCLRSEDVVARFGGDEFLILVSEIKDSRDAVTVAEKILKSMELPVKIGEHTLHPSVSVGIAVFPGDGSDLESLKKKADIALYRAKEGGRNRFSLYDPSLDSMHAAERFILENELREALLLNQIIVYYQPILSLKRRRVVAVEALARWQHPTKGLLPPSEFIPLAEETGLIAQLDQYVLKQACQQAKLWQKRGLPKFRVAVNLSAQQFSEPGFISTISESLAESRLDAGVLELEITESLAMSNLELTSFNLKSLKKLGVHITIDDFGTGYSSLSYLKRFPIHTLKIDKSFVRHCITNPQDTSITRTIAAIAHTLNLKVIAEGVETDQQMGFLASLGCDAAQGFYICPPVPPEQLEQWFGQKPVVKEESPVAVLKI